MGKNPGVISRVTRSKAQARTFYDRIARSYDWLGGLFERRPAISALKLLKVQSGERVLEIGFGTGYCLKKLAAGVGNTGKVCGIDISRRMLLQAEKRLAKASLSDRVELCCGDALQLPFPDSTFNAVFLSFTLELFDSPEIPVVLSEVKRVLKTGGRLGVVALSKPEKPSSAVDFYEWVHYHWPQYVDCRPIYLATNMQAAGYTLLHRAQSHLVFFPVVIVIASI